ncbi:structural protein P5 [Bacteroides sp.]|uniref:structural protein P5 n=1 Tax=Bacteroides sp. TaxID=29523 RepID=UPI00261D6F90|nr:structural protein P5 [Bacteroides sp.]MDD3039513.1 structural protein P5 [Bacteroides sp.]
MSRGISNCNPGNIRISKVKYLGEVTPSKDKAFKQFSTMAWGYRAMFVLLHTYSKNGYKTIRQMINRYAPPIENHTENYIKFVAERAKIFADVEIDTTDPAEMIPIVSAMSQMENGVAAVVEQVQQGWELYMQHRS